MCGPLRLSGFDAQAVGLCDVDTRVSHGDDRCSGLEQGRVIPWRQVGNGGIESLFGDVAYLAVR